jgi:hypothetical protein
VGANGSVGPTGSTGPIGPVGSNSVRYSLTQTVTRAPITNVGFSPNSLFTINLPAQFSGCNVFTFYIRSITGSASTGSTVPITYIFYPSNTANGAYDGSTGAMNQIAYTQATGTQAFTTTNTVLNYRSTLTGNTLYFNFFLTSATQTFSTTNLEVIFDVIGETMTLV